MTLAEYTALLFLGIAVSFTPGPNTALSATMGAQGGLKSALPFVIGVPFGWGLLLTSSVLGISAVLANVASARLGVAILGTGYLLWLAKRLATAPALPADTPAAALAPTVGYYWRPSSSGPTRRPSPHGVSRSRGRASWKSRPPPCVLLPCPTVAADCFRP